MILQDLIEYYHQYKNANDSQLAPFGFEYKEISFLIVLSKKGDFLDIQDTRSADGSGKKMLVPKAVKRSGVGCHPNYLWDNAKYLFGEGSFTKQKQQKALLDKKQSFLKNLKKESFGLQDNAEMQAVISFLEGYFPEKLQKHPLWKEILDLNPNLSFSIEGTNRLVCQQQEIMKAFSTFFADQEETLATCLLTGEKAPIARLHPLIQGVYGAQGSGANLVSYNMPSAESFDKEQGYNAPMSQSAVFAYSTALNHLLNSSQKVSFNEAMTLIFWGGQKTNFEDLFAKFLKISSKEPASFFLSKLLEETADDSLFFIKIISPQGARLSMRFSWTGTIGTLKKNLKAHFQDIDMMLSSGEPETLSVYSLLQAFSPCSDVKHVSSHLAGAFLVSLLNDSPYPQNLLPVLIEKLSNREGISRRRVALLKAWINREEKTNSNSHPKQEIKAYLDESNQNTGYLLGRLFAILETARKKTRQRKEAPSVHNFYKTASRSPQKTFDYLLKRHALHELYLPPAYVRCFKEIRESLLQMISKIPPSLSLKDQGKFAIGYFHQKQQLFLELKKE